MFKDSSKRDVPAKKEMPDDYELQCPISMPMSNVTPQSPVHTASRLIQIRFESVRREKESQTYITAAELQECEFVRHRPKEMAINYGQQNISDVHSGCIAAILEG
ncbi:hypothetical protein NDU88_001370 [Pleurodeles waltl]|uniref:Uncharacterized protein n=1 Tax=Pleurodeles waltl TaxID=8319 RepID=A0AAV7RAY0_PLEWA|nr:hypothetical protein NDU88_001370 [Pleurodeles waltl]